MVNSAGRAYSRSFGFGLLNASRLVAMAKGWSTVASQLIVETQGPVDDAGNASSTAAPGRNISQAVDVAGCSPGSDGTLCIAVLEHVVLRLAVTVANRGLLDVAITSPTGTVSKLIAPRSADSFAGDFVWDFMTLQHWGEPAAGNWTLAISSRAAVTLRSWEVVAHGTGATTAVRSRGAGAHRAGGCAPERLRCLRPSGPVYGRAGQLRRLRPGMFERVLRAGPGRVRGGGRRPGWPHRRSGGR